MKHTDNNLCKQNVLRFVTASAFLRRHITLASTSWSSTTAL